MNKKVTITIFIGILFSIVSYLYVHNNRTSDRLDSWSNLPPKSIMDSVIKNDSRGNVQYCSVLPKMQNSAILLLSKKPSIPLTNEDLAVYLGEDKISGINKELTPFLVRALVVTKGATEYYSVSRVANDLWVDNPALPIRRADPIRMERQAIIVFLAHPPRAVYVTAGLMAI